MSSMQTGAVVPSSSLAHVEYQLFGPPGVVKSDSSADIISASRPKSKHNLQILSAPSSTTRSLRERGDVASHAQYYSVTLLCTTRGDVRKSANGEDGTRPPDVEHARTDRETKCSRALEGEIEGTVVSLFVWNP